MHDPGRMYRAGVGVMDDLIADKWTRELEARIHMAYDMDRCPQTEEEFHE